MAIVKTIINISKKLLKLILILAVIGGVVAGAVYLWIEYENKKEQELNLAFFNTLVPMEAKSPSWVVKGIEWRLTDNPKNDKGIYQYGFDSNGKLFYREVSRNISPPNVLVYHMGINDEDNEFRTISIWIVDCAPSSSTSYDIGGENTATLKCSDNGEYLFTTLIHTSKSLIYYNQEVNANGFSARYRTSPFDMNELLQNKTLMKLESK